MQTFSNNFIKQIMLSRLDIDNEKNYFNDDQIT